MGCLPKFDSPVFDPEYDAVLHHKFESTPAACYLTVRLTTLEQHENVGDWRVVGYAAFPIYRDIETDEAPTKMTKVETSDQNFFMSEGRFRVPIFMEDVDISHMSFSDL